MHNNNANRLFNVALTRAKGKFICVTNAEYMKKKRFSKNHMFKHMLDEQFDNPNRILSGSKFARQKENISNSNLSFYKMNSGNQHFINDISKAKIDIRIDIPDKPADMMYLPRLVNELKKAQNRGVDVIIRAEAKANLPLILKPLAIQNALIYDPIAIIDKQIIWFGEPISNANFISKGKSSYTKYRPIIRFVGKHTATSLYSLMEMRKS